MKREGVELLHRMSLQCRLYSACCSWSSINQTSIQSATSFRNCSHKFPSLFFTFLLKIFEQFQELYSLSSTFLLPQKVEGKKDVPKQYNFYTTRYSGFLGFLIVTLEDWYTLNTWSGVFCIGLLLHFQTGPFSVSPETFLSSATSFPSITATFLAFLLINVDFNRRGP